MDRDAITNKVSFLAERVHFYIASTIRRWSSMPHPFLIALWFIVRIAVLVALIWGAYTLAQIRKTLQAAKQVT